MNTHLDSNPDEGLVLNQVLCCSLVDHSKRPGADLTQNLDLFSRDLPLVRYIDCKYTNIKMN